MDDGSELVVMPNWRAELANKLWSERKEKEAREKAALVEQQREQASGQAIDWDTQFAAKFAEYIDPYLDMIGEETGSAEVQREHDQEIAKLRDEIAALHRELDTEKRMMRFESDLLELRRANGADREGEKVVSLPRKNVAR